MNQQENTSLSTAEFLLQIKAIKLEPNNPFTWTSGIKSPIYTDNRKILSYPKVRTYVRQEFSRIISEEFPDLDLIAGVATGAIAHGVLVAQELGLPFVYVRSEKKSHGLENKIEGVVESGQSVVVIEDLVSTGKSSLQAIHALREAGCNVKGMVAIFSYLLPEAVESFKKNNVRLFTLTDYDILIKKALMIKYISDNDLHLLMEWRKNPSAWGK